MMLISERSSYEREESASPRRLISESVTLRTNGVSQKRVPYFSSIISSAWT